MEGDENVVIVKAISKMCSGTLCMLRPLVVGMRRNVEQASLQVK